MSSLIIDNKLFEINNEIWEKGSNNFKKEFDSEPVYGEVYLKTKIRSDEEKIITNFHNNTIPKENSHCICLSVILINYVFRAGNNYNYQVFLEECIRVIKRREGA